jgi:hypothetical protein
MGLARVRRLAAIVIVGGVAGLSAGLQSAHANEAVSNLDGSWSGSGSVSMQNGDNQRVKCRATSNVNSGHASQSLRCASPNSQINVNVSFLVNGDGVSGNWSESRSGNHGTLTGGVSGNAITLRLRGQDFNGTMRLAVARCSQSVAINTSGADLRSANIQLRKC